MVDLCYFIAFEIKINRDERLLFGKVIEFHEYVGLQFIDECLLIIHFYCVNNQIFQIFLIYYYI